MRVNIHRSLRLLKCLHWPVSVLRQGGKSTTQSGRNVAGDGGVLALLHAVPAFAPSMAGRRVTSDVMAGTKPRSGVASLTPGIAELDEEFRMLIRRFRPGDSAGIRPSEITSESVYLERRKLLQAALAAGVAGIGAAWTQRAGAVSDLQVERNARYSLSDPPNSYEDITTYNNYYEFGLDKGAPAANSGRFKPAPWTVAVKGEAENTGSFALEDILKGHAIEERVYRLRCVEAWSMVVPWDGVPLASVLKQFKPTSKAKYVAFKTVYRPEEMPGQRSRSLDWPYVEGLRIDEAMHPLSLLVVGLYGKTLPNQNGAPLRLMTPWKYGFKGIKSIVEINFTQKQPPTSWNISAPQEYGFYANVNPKVDHPRWSQARERKIGAGLFGSRVPTLMFNGYEQEVASLYQGMDLKKYY
jgi:methionine sulfoxide reductase catalytic subunit